MMKLEKKYPFFHFINFESYAPGMSQDEYDRRHREIWRHDEELLGRARRLVSNADMFLFSRLHDSEVISSTLEGDCLTIGVDDDIFYNSFCAINSLLNHGVDLKRIRVPVTIRIEGIRKITAFKIEDRIESHGNQISCGYPDSLTEVPVRMISGIRTFLYDELAKITSRSLSIGFVFGMRDQSNMIFDIDARKISFEEDLRSNFVSCFGESNLDIFAALYKMRQDRTLGWNSDTAIRVVRQLRPQLPDNYDVQDFYIWRALEMSADAARQKGKFSEAFEIYKDLVSSHHNRHLIWKKIAECLFGLKRYSEALLYIHALLGHDRNDINAHFLLAQTWHRLDDAEDAAEELAKCLKINPGYKPALQFIARHKKIRKIMDEDAEYEDVVSH